MAMPADLDAAFRKFIPPFGAAGNPVDITGGEPPKTYQNTVRLGLEDDRIHALILGYWHTIVTPPMVFAKLMVEVVEEMKAKGIDKPVVASLAGDVRGRGSRRVPVRARHPGLRRTRPRSRSRCSAPSTSGRAARGCSKPRAAHEADARRGDGDPIALVGRCAVLRPSASSRPAESDVS